MTKKQVIALFHEHGWTEDTRAQTVTARMVTAFYRGPELAVVTKDSIIIDLYGVQSIARFARTIPAKSPILKRVLRLVK